MEEDDDPPTLPSFSLSLMGGGTAVGAAGDGFIVLDISDKLGLGR